MIARSNLVHCKPRMSQEFQSLSKAAIESAKNRKSCHGVLNQKRPAGGKGLLDMQAVDMERAQEGKEKKERADRDALKRSTVAQTFLGLFRKENETEKPSQQEATPRSWSLPIPFWKRT